MSFFTAANALAPDALTMGFLRFWAGVGLGGSPPQPGIYVSEYIPAKYRGVSWTWVYGALLSLLLPYTLFPVFGWRLTFLAALTLLALVPLIMSLMPESIRYIQLRGRVDEVLMF